MDRLTENTRNKRPFLRYLTPSFPAALVMHFIVNAALGGRELASS